MGGQGFERSPRPVGARRLDGCLTDDDPARAGVREVRVIGSLLAHRLEQATGAPPDPALVKKLAVELYLTPKRKPDVVRLDLPLAQPTRKWLLRGVFGRDTRKAAEKALDAAEQLDLDRVLETRRAAD